MDSSTRIFIDNLAEAVIDAYGITIPIDNIEDVVKKIGGEIVEKADLQYNQNKIIAISSRPMFLQTGVEIIDKDYSLC